MGTFLENKAATSWERNATGGVPYQSFSRILLYSPVSEKSWLFCGDF
ncbi:hypothetical protein [Anaerobacterium chartisolvens]|nr:hypothetical protein [Anaerobacterium chartisolvens]